MRSARPASSKHSQSTAVNSMEMVSTRGANARATAHPSCCVCFLRQEFGVRTDRFQLVFPQAVQLLLIDPAFAQEPPQHMRKARTAKVIFAVNFRTALGQVKFQVPKIRRLLDLVGHSLCFLNHLLKFLGQSSVEGFARDGFF